MAKGCWIFLSHSSKDIIKVREIRNLFEKYGQNPLAFHLKCLNTDTIESEEELLSLLKREIKARDWFVFCNSENSRLSKYVQIERNYISSLDPSKIVINLDIEEDTTALEEKIKHICTVTKAFISYSICDQKFAIECMNKLIGLDFDVYIDIKMSLGDDWYKEIDTHLTDVAECGVFVILLSKNYLKSEHALLELDTYLSKAKNPHILPIMIEEIREQDFSQTIKVLLSKGQFQHFENVLRLMNLLIENIIIKYSSLSDALQSFKKQLYSEK